MGTSGFTLLFYFLDIEISCLKKKKKASITWKA